MSAETAAVQMASEPDLDVEPDDEPDRSCPSWCTDHDEAVADEADPLEHASRPLELGWLPELRAVTGEVTRASGGHVDSRLVLGPGARRALISVIMRDLDAECAQLLLTSGEARTVAAQLLALADTVDLARD